MDVPTVLVATQLYVPAFPLLTVLILMVGPVPRRCQNVFVRICSQHPLNYPTYDLLLICIEILDPFNGCWRIGINLEMTNDQKFCHSITYHPSSPHMRAAGSPDLL